jgi:hypothetical protein
VVYHLREGRLGVADEFGDFQGPIASKSFGNHRTWPLRRSAQLIAQIAVALEATSPNQRAHRPSKLVAKLPDLEIRVIPNTGHAPSWSRIRTARVQGADWRSRADSAIPREYRVQDS